MRARIGRCGSAEALPLVRRQLYFQSLRNLVRDFSFDLRNILGSSLISVCPKLPARLRVDQLEIDHDILGHLLHATCEKSINPQPRTKFSEISWAAFIFLRRAPRHHLQPAHLRDLRKNFITHAARKIGAILVFG